MSWQTGKRGVGWIQGERHVLPDNDPSDPPPLSRNPPPNNCQL